MLTDEPRPRYGSVFAQASFQFCGHVDDYLIANTRHLALFYCQPRFGEHHHVLRRYEEGRLVEERSIRSSQQIFAYYFLWFWHHSVELWRFARRRKETTLVLCGHPVCFFGATVMRLLCRLRYAYAIGDYFPSKGFVIRAFERLKKFDHDRADFAYYLTDAINRQMNGGVVRTERAHRTVMWGMKPFDDCLKPRPDSRRVLFVGLVRPGQGVEKMLDFLATHADFSLALVGVAANGFETEIVRMVAERNLADRVYFENRFHSERELRDIAKTCLCGLALYDTAPDNFTHYADPGKVKAYAELGLPVVMTRISDIVPFVERFRTGIVIDSTEEIGAAVERIAAEPEAFAAGVAAFNAHFDYRTYYPPAYAAWEDLWK